MSPGRGIPEIKWGLFTDADHVTHIAPVLGEDRILMNGHVLAANCPCGATWYRAVVGGPIVRIIHNVIH